MSANIAYLWYSIMHLPIALVFMINPTYVTPLLFKIPEHEETDFSFHILLDVLRIVGCYLFFFASFTFFMITVKDRRSRNVYHLAMSLKCFTLCCVLLFINTIRATSTTAISSSRTWSFIGKWLLLIYYAVTGVIFALLWVNERRGRRENVSGKLSGSSETTSGRLVQNVMEMEQRSYVPSNPRSSPSVYEQPQTTLATRSLSPQQQYYSSATMTSTPTSFYNEEQQQGLTRRRAV